MTTLALDAVYRDSPMRRTTLRRLIFRREERVGVRAAQRLSLSSAGYLYAREGSLDRQQASDNTVERSLLVAEGDLVVNPMWLVGGSIAVSALAGSVSPDYRVFKVGPEVDGRYLHHVLRSAPYRAQYELFVRANTTFDRRIQQSDLDDMPVWVPPLDQQRRIADFLDDRVARVDQAVTARQKQTRSLRSALQLAVDEAMAHMNARVRASRVTGILPGYAFESSAYSGDPLQTPLLRGVNVGVGELRWDDAVYWPNDRLSEVSRFQLNPGDVVLGMDRPWIGAGLRIAQIPEGQHPLLLQRVAKFEPRGEVLAEYLFWAYQESAFRHEIESSLTGLSVPHLSGDQILQHHLAFGGLEAQRRTVRRLEKIREQVQEGRRTLSRSIELLTEYKQSLITAAVTGEFDVTTASTKIPREQA